MGKTAVCDTVIYNQKHGFGLLPVCGTEHLKLLEFPE